jgi:AcrR family transcriptional regulator
VDSPLSIQGLLADDALPADAVDERILDAALEQFALVGIRRTSADDIARRASVNRTTLYRRMGTKEQIVRSAVLHETRRILTQVAAAIQGIDDVSERITQGFVVSITILRGNPLFRQVLASEREDTLVWLTIDAGETLKIATTFVAAQIRRAWSDRGLPDDANAEPIAAILVRLVHSLILTPDAPPDLHSTEQLRTFALSYIRPLIDGGTAASLCEMDGSK